MKKCVTVIVLALAAIIGLPSCKSGETGIEATSADIAITHVNLIPMTAEVMLPDQTVLVEGDKIVSIGDASEIKIQSGVQVIDGEGAYLFPGLADMHVHIREESREDMPVSPFHLYVANGVTTIRDCGTNPLSHSDTFVLDWRDEITRGESLGPMIYSSGRTIHGPVSSPGDVVRERKAKGFDFVKLYMELSPEEFSEAQVVAEELGMFSVGHIPYQVGLDGAIAAGLDEIAHIEELSFELMWSDQRPSHTLSMEQWLNSIVGEVFDTYGFETGSDMVFSPEEFDRVQGERLDRYLKDLTALGIPVGTTLAVYEVVDQKLFDQEAFLKRAENIYLPEELIGAVLSGQDRHQLILEALGENAAAWEWKRDLDVHVLRRLHEAGVLLVSGTDAGSPSIGVVEGFATHDDLRLLTEYGYAPYEALKTATVNAARTIEQMNGEGDFGTIEPGKRADFVLVGRNPLEDIRNTKEILGVMARGKWYSAEELEEMVSLDSQVSLD